MFGGRRSVFRGEFEGLGGKLPLLPWHIERQAPWCKYNYNKAVARIIWGGGGGGGGRGLAYCGCVYCHFLLQGHFYLHCTVMVIANLVEVLQGGGGGGGGGNYSPALSISCDVMPTVHAKVERSCRNLSGFMIPLTLQVLLLSLDENLGFTLLYCVTFY